MATPAALARRLGYQGPALFSYGFRPFFLGGAVWAALGILLWLPQAFGELALPTAMTPLDWHIHEMIFGYVTAVIAGFLLTAIPNWTGRLPVCGFPLALLAALWLCGRIAILFSQVIGVPAAAAVDICFLVVLALMALREVLAGSNWRNLRVLVVLGVLVAGNVVFHLEVLSSGVSEYGPRIGIAAVIGLIMLIGGRIVPSFTHNWIVRRNPGRLPAGFSRFDAVSLLLAASALAAWITAPHHDASGVLMLIAGAVQGLRLARWAGDRTLADRLVLVLHVGYAFVPLGFLLIGSSILWPAIIPYSAGIHAWTTGGIGTMTLAVMTRASLGHTKQPLTASVGTQAIYLLVAFAAFARIVAAFTATIALLHVAAFAWAAAFGAFAVSFGPLLIRRPPVWAGRS
jgi:uncharacterized protein involved in response to NO